VTQPSASACAVSDDSTLWRRIPPLHAVKDGDGWRPSSAAFEDPEGMSVAVAEIAGSFDDMMKGHDEFGLVSFPAKLLVDLGFTLVMDETPDTYKGHALAFIDVSRSARKRIAKKIAKAAAWVRLPKGIC
jgi:hypothetical protein